MRPLILTKRKLIIGDKSIDGYYTQRQLPQQMRAFHDNA